MYEVGGGGILTVCMKLGWGYTDSMYEVGVGGILTVCMKLGLY